MSAVEASEAADVTRRSSRKRRQKRGEEEEDDDDDGDVEPGKQECSSVSKKIRLLRSDLRDSLTEFEQ